MSTASDWRRARRERRSDERRLPEGLRRDIRVIRREDLGHAHVQAILDEVEHAARRHDAVRTVHSSSAPPWSYVAPAVERDLLRKLDRNAAYHRQVRADVRSTLRTAHLTKIDPGAARITDPEHLGPAPRVEDGLLSVDSSIGLGTASVLEAEPEGWNHWVAANLADHDPGDEDDTSLGLDEHGERRAFVLGALAGGFARVVTAMALPRLTLTEFDWVLATATNLPCVEGRAFPACSGQFDAAVAVLPSPATSGAANQRRIYGRSEADPARLGPRRWIQSVLGYLGVVNGALKQGGYVYALLPSGVRDEHGYLEAPELLEPILSRLGECGFNLMSNIPTIEVGPVAQPFVGTARPPKTTLVLKMARAVGGL